MPTLYELGKSRMNHHELGFIREDGQIDIWCYGYQPTTNDIAERAMKRVLGGPKYTYVIQLIGGQFEVYDLATLKRQSAFGQDFTIGQPVVTHENLDAAIMAAVLLS